jgi:hypothetical protein
MPPILDPRELMPDHLIERFREEFRVRQAEIKQKEAEQQRLGWREQAAAAVERPRESGERVERERPTLEGYREARGLAPRPPSLPSDVRTRVHGGKSGPFVQFAGSQSTLCDQPVSPRPGRRHLGCRAAESSIGALLGSPEHRPESPSNLRLRPE